MPWRGSIAHSTSGWRASDTAPSPPITTNQSSMTGPNSRPMRSVPTACSANSATRMAAATGSTTPPRSGVATLTPSMALSTEIDGVRMPSP